MEKQEPKMFRARGQSKKFYVDKAIKDYIKSEAQIKAVIQLGYANEDLMNRIKQSVYPDVDYKCSELCSFLKGSNSKLSSNNKEYEELLNSITEK